VFRSVIRLFIDPRKTRMLTYKVVYIAAAATVSVVRILRFEKEA